MQKRSFNVDFSKKCGKVKPMHGLNLSFEHNSLGDDPISELLSSYSPAVVGLHDLEHPYGQNQYVDIHAIFPNFDADTECEASYNFAPTDSYLEKVKESGAEIIFRLGESTDSYRVKPFIKSPRDASRFARVCLHIVMHYNAKWASGYKWNIKYFEIWSGADSSSGYIGELSDYVVLYSETARLLKSEFPRIRVGGYSSLGFSAMNRVSEGAEVKAAYAFAESFLNEIARLNAPLDFFTWCARTVSAEELSLHTKYAKSLLRASPYRNAKSIISEFELTSRTSADAAEYLGAMIAADKSDADMMLYKHWRKCEEKELADAVYSAVFGAGDRADISEDYRRELYLISAHSDNGGVIALSSLDFMGAVEIFISGSEPSSFDITEISPKEGGGYARAGLNGAQIKNKRIAFRAKPRSLYLVYLK